MTRKKSAKPDSRKINAASSGPSSTSYSPSLAHPAPDEVSEIGSPPIPQNLRDLAKKVRAAAEGANEGSVDANLDELIKYISSLSAFIKQKKKEKKKPKKEKPKLATNNLSDAKNYMKLMDALSEAIDVIKEFTSSDAKTIAQGFLKDIMGTLHVVNIAFIVMANAWERCEEMSKNQEACVSLLEEMNKLAQFVREFQKEHKEVMKAEISDATALIVETSMVCCTQIEASNTRRYSSTTEFAEELAKLEKQLQQMYTYLQLRMQFLGLTLINQLMQSLPSRDMAIIEKLPNPENPKDAVGTKKPVQLPVYPQHADETQKPLRLPNVSDHAKTVMEAAKAIDKENVDVDFSDLINYISELLRFIEEDVFPGERLLKGMGASHMATTGLLPVPNNEEARLSLLKETKILAIHVQEFQKRPALKEGMEASIREAIVLIVEASMACCTQIDRPKFSRFFKTTVDGVELAKFQKQLSNTRTRMQTELEICQFDARVTREFRMHLQSILFAICKFLVLVLVLQRIF